MKQKFILGTRGSNLALTQTRDVKARLENAFPELDVEINVIKTEGDKDLKSSLASMGGRGVFVQSIEKALFEKKVDAAVHSLKDLPSGLPGGLMLGASPERVDPRDAFISRDGVSLASLPKGSVIGTGSERRRIQLAKICPCVTFKNIRGNIETRLDKLSKDEYDAIILAGAALTRLDMKFIVTEFLDVETVVPAPCQGAIGIECRSDDERTIGILNKIDDPEVRMCVDAERTFINILGMGCHTPVGAYAASVAGGISFTAFVGSDDWGIIQKTVKTSKGKLTDTVKKLASDFRLRINKNNENLENK
jgi:hydroxymethylbilane synthase